MIRTADTFKSWHSKLELSNRKQTVIGRGNRHRDADGL